MSNTDNDLQYSLINCLEKSDIRMRKMMGRSWNRAENPPYTNTTKIVIFFV
jgi:hypothetical protein